MSHVGVNYFTFVLPFPLTEIHWEQGCVCITQPSFSLPSVVLGMWEEPCEGREARRETGGQQRESTARSQGRQVDMRFSAPWMAVLDLTPCRSFPLYILSARSLILSVGEKYIIKPSLPKVRFRERKWLTSCHLAGARHWTKAETSALSDRSRRPWKVLGVQSFGVCD